VSGPRTAASMAVPIAAPVAGRRQHAARHSW
jgi:hypothetical protein